MGQVVDKNGKPVAAGEEALTREQEVNLLQELMRHPGWAVYSNLLRLNWQKSERLVLNPEYPRDYEGHTDDFLKGLIRGYQQSNALPEVAMQQWLDEKAREAAKAAKEAADTAAGHGEPGFRKEALPPDFNDEGITVPVDDGGEG